MPRSNATRIASTPCCGSCSRRRARRTRRGRPRARRLRAPASVSALGHRSARAVRRPIGARRGAVLRALLQPALGPRRRRRPPGAGARRLPRSSRPTTRSSCWRCSTRGRWPALACCSIVSDALFHTPATHAHILTSLLQLIDERHARFNAHAVSAGARRQGSAGRAARPGGDAHDRAADRPAAAAPRARRSGAVRRRARTSCCACARRCTWRRDRNQNVLSHELQERTAELLGYPGAEPRQRVERLMSDYFRHARIVGALAGVGAQDRACAGRARISVCRATACASSIRFRPRAIPTSWIGAFQAAIDSGTDGHRGSARRASSSTWIGTAPTISFPRPSDRAALLALLKPRPGLYARLSEMHDCGLLGRVFPEFQAISWRVVRDFYHKYTVDEHTLLTIRNLERLPTTDGPAAGSGSATCCNELRRTGAARAGAAAARRRQVARRRSRARKRAHGARRARPAAARPARRARRCSS